MRILELAGELKQLKRSGWQRNGIPDPESVAEHSYRTALIAMLFAPGHVDSDKCIRMALVHDLAEAEVGDLTPHDNPEDAPQERDVFREFHPAVQDLCEEYHAGKTPEAKWVKDADMLEMVMQASEYAEEFDADYEEFWEYADERITTEPGRELFELLSERR